MMYSKKYPHSTGMLTGIYVPVSQLHAAIGDADKLRSAEARDSLTGCRPMQGGAWFAAIPALAKAASRLVPKAAKVAGKWIVKHPGKAVLLASAAGKVANLVGARPGDGSGDADSSAESDEPQLLESKELLTPGVSQETDAEAAALRLTGKAARALYSLFDDEDMGVLLKSMASMPANEGDVFTITPTMMAVAARLGELHARRKELAPIAKLFQGDPVAALSARVPLSSMKDDGSIAPQMEFAVDALNGGLLDKIKSAVSKVATKIAPAVQKVAGAVSNVAGFIPGVGSVVSKVADVVKNVAGKVADAGKKVVSKVGSAISSVLPGAKAKATQPSASGSPQPAASLTGQARSNTADAVAQELQRWEGENMPPALYGDPMGDESEMSQRDAMALRELFAPVVVPGIAIAAEYGVKPSTAFAGAADLSDMEEITDPNAATPSGEAAPEQAELPQLAPIAPAGDLVDTDATGKPTISAKARQQAAAVTGTTANADPLYDRAFSTLTRLTHDVDSGNVQALDDVDIPDWLMEGRTHVDIAGKEFRLTAKQFRDFLRDATAIWLKKPKKAATPLVRASSGALAVTAMLREAQDDALRKKLGDIAAALVRFLRLPVDRENALLSIIDTQATGAASVEEARSLSDAIADALLRIEALLSASTGPTKLAQVAKRAAKAAGRLAAGPLVAGALSRVMDGSSLAEQAEGLLTSDAPMLPKGKRVSPAIKALASYVASLISKGVNARDLASNAGLVSELVREYRATRKDEERFAIDDEDFSNRVVNRAAAGEGPTSDDESLWAKAKDWLAPIGKFLDDDGVQRIATLLGFSTAAIPLVKALVRRSGEETMDPGKVHAAALDRAGEDQQTFEEAFAHPYNPRYGETGDEERLVIGVRGDKEVS